MDTCAGWRAEKRGSRGKRRKGRRRNGQRIEEGRQRIEGRMQRAGRERVLRLGAAGRAGEAGDKGYKRGVPDVKKRRVYFIHQAVKGILTRKRLCFALLS